MTTTTDAPARTSAETTKNDSGNKSKNSSSNIDNNDVDNNDVGSRGVPQMTSRTPGAKNNKKKKQIEGTSRRIRRAAGDHSINSDKHANTNTTVP